jgi:hypothetical protein
MIFKKNTKEILDRIDYMINEKNPKKPKPAPEYFWIILKIRFIK